MQLNQYPILHSFLVRLYTEIDLYEMDDLYNGISQDIVTNYCRCGDTTCATLYLKSQYTPVIEDDEYTE